MLCNDRDVPQCLVQVYCSAFIFPLDVLLLDHFYLQELEYQKKRPQELGDKFVSVVSQFITVASFSFSDVEDSLAETKELVCHRGRCSVLYLSGADSITVTCRHRH